MFTNALVPYFSKRSRERAGPYLEPGRILDFFCDFSGIGAKVRGTRIYKTSFIANYDDQWEPFCSCPAFDEEDPCKHLWALLRYCEILDSRSPRQLGINEKFHIGQHVLAWFNVNADENEISETIYDLYPADDFDEPEWRLLLDQLVAADSNVLDKGGSRNSNSRLALVLNAKKSSVMKRLVFQIYAMQGKAKKHKILASNRSQIMDFANPFERDLLNYFVDLNGAGYRDSYSHIYTGMKEVILPSERISDLLWDLAARSMIFASAKDLHDSLPMEFLEKSEAQSKYIIELADDAALSMDLRFWDESWDLSWKDSKAQLVCAHYAIWERVLVKLPALDSKGVHWLNFIESGVNIERKDAAEFLSHIRSVIPKESIEIPEMFDFTEVQLSPLALLKFTRRGDDRGIFLSGEIFFRYEDIDVRTNPQSLVLTDNVNRRIIHRDKEGERVWIGRIESHPDILADESGNVTVYGADFADAVTFLVAQGCAVYLNRKPVQIAEPRIEFSSGIDWLNFKCFHDSEEIDIEAVLRAFQSSASFITLNDGSSLILDRKIQRILERFVRLTQKNGDALVVSKQKIPFLDQIIRDLPGQPIPEAVAAYRDALSAPHDSVESPGQGFKGKLRPYQLDGFRWLSAMTRLSFGVCLADEMGLGKTIQILALVENRQEVGAVSLIVMPRSLIGNWHSEIEKFAPRLKVLNYSEAKREKADFSSWDIVLTTYGVLLRDQALLAETSWQHVILDEAQAIKNLDSKTAKAARSLSGLFRVALSGTPIENSTTDLLSLFSFLNPGMLGRTTQEILRQQARDPEDLKALARSIRPLMLGRRKEDVLKELPEKEVNILYCEMDRNQRKIYKDVVRAYKERIADSVENSSFKKSKLLMIEAMLRLRQISCHPSMVDKIHEGSTSAKVEILMEKLGELEGTPDKVLIFSQFTSFLKLIETRLVKANIIYEYLDGKTKNRSDRVANFQNNPSIKVFLISLKAGGVGLNLTAARYAFLMDPWWNPAVEEQAIARAHRIGQSQKVIVYKIVAKDSIEEKILELQAQKGDLVRTFMEGGEQKLMRQLSPEDLELLMS